MRRYVWGRLDQFLECFSVFFCISSAFLPWNHLPEFFCISRGLFSAFSWKNWRHFADALRCCRFKCVGPFVHGFFKIFSMPTTHPMLNNRLADLLPAPVMLAPPFSGDSVAVSAELLRARRIRFQTRWQSLWPTCFISPSQLLSLRFVQRTSHCPFSRVTLSPVSSVVCQPCLGFHQLAFLSCRYVEIATFLVSPFTAVSTAPGSCLAPLARSIEASIMASHVFSCVFLHTAKVWTKSCDRRLCLD